MVKSAIFHADQSFGGRSVLFIVRASSILLFHHIIEIISLSFVSIVHHLIKQLVEFILYVVCSLFKIFV